MSRIWHDSLLNEARVSKGRTPVLVKDTKVDRFVTEARDNVRHYVARSLTIVHTPIAGGPDPQVLGYRDAADECRHGSLPTDRVIGCTCWDTMELAA